MPTDDHRACSFARLHAISVSWRASPPAAAAASPDRGAPLGVRVARARCGRRCLPPAAPRPYAWRSPGCPPATASCRPQCARRWPRATPRQGRLPVPSLLPLSPLPVRAPLLLVHAPPLPRQPTGAPSPPPSSSAASPAPTYTSATPSDRPRSGAARR